MSRGDSEKPNFDDLDFSNLEPMDGDALEGSTSETAEEGLAAEDDFMELDFAAADPVEGSAELSEPAVVETPPTSEPELAFAAEIPLEPAVVEAPATDASIVADEPPAVIEPIVEEAAEPVVEDSPIVESVAIEAETTFNAAESSGIDFSFADSPEEAADTAVSSGSGLLFDAMDIEPEAAEPLEAPLHADSAETEAAGLSGLMFDTVEPQHTAEENELTFDTVEPQDTAEEGEAPVEFGADSENAPAEELGATMFATADDAEIAGEKPAFEEEPHFDAAAADDDGQVDFPSSSDVGDFGGFGEAAGLAAATGVAADEDAADELEDEASDEPKAKPQSKMAAFVTGLSESNPYTVLLGVALGAILLACTFLLVEWWRYDFTTSKDSIRKRITSGPRAAVQCVEPTAHDTYLG